MADSTADATASNADTLRLELHKVLTEIFYDGVGKDRGETEGSSGVLKAIDEAVIRILDCMKKVESKKPESDISPVIVPKEFICTLSNKIMIEPMTIASGQTYENRCITEWLKHKRTCPKTKEILSHVWLTPNHLINELITQWCLFNKVDRPKPSDEIVIKVFTDDLEPLLQRISSPSSVADQIEAAEELRRQTKKYDSACVFFVTELPDSVTRLLTPLLSDDVDLNPELQENIITSLFNISNLENVKNQKVIAENPLVIPLLTKSLKKGTVLTRRNAAATLASLADIDSNRNIIRNSEALKALIDVIGEWGDCEAGNAVFKLCFGLENKEKAISAGLIPVLIKNIKAGRNACEMLHVLVPISTNNRAIKEMEDLGFVFDLFRILRKPNCLVTGELALDIIFNMFEKNRDRSRLEEEERMHETFTNLSYDGSDNATRKAKKILQWIKTFADRKEQRQRERDDRPLRVYVRRNK
ncbi:unnamed protein product [Arabidopsis arenosa]|uniref:RING-type E3 ubiquitin transferase n=1 Tax=Arabidopsis arenosa TaxID=38785 RepID=A0A8S2AUA3_ARAAE|nr:unnamed protein product [Arabidopsis arenosa]